MTSALVMEVTELERMKKPFIRAPFKLFRWSAAVCVAEKGSVQLVTTQLRFATSHEGLGNTKSEPETCFARSVSQKMFFLHARFNWFGSRWESVCL
uniref:Uncharacterized protein n=1 Tax=Arundo donax TaxID=35708 RepID=A0A0A9GYH9_ARUDO